MCDNFTNYIDTVNNVCGKDVILVMDDCNSYCLLSIVLLLNKCLSFLVELGQNVDTELENIVKFCYQKTLGNEVGH